MKNKIIIAVITTVTIASLASTLPVFAENDATASTSTTVSTSTTTKDSSTKIEKKVIKMDKAMLAAKEKGIKEIDSRVSNLNKLLERISKLKNVTNSQKVSISATVNGVISTLNNLKNEMETTESTTTMKADLQSITTNFRVYALVMPQISIVTSADRINTLVDMMSVISTKLTNRLITATGTPNLSELQVLLGDFNTSVANAKIASDNAVQEVSALVPDQGDKTLMASNNAALKDARAKIISAEKDLKTARKNAGTIIKSLIETDKYMLKSKNATSTSAKGLRLPADTKDEKKTSSSTSSIESISTTTTTN
jgi:hypothetical protein